MRGLVIDKWDVMVLGHRVREVDWQYEYNNNCELDNGVYNKFMVEKQKDQPEDAEEIKMSDLEEMIQSQTIKDKKHWWQTSKS